MAASANVSALLVAVRTLAPGVSDGPAGNVLGPSENVTDDDIQDAMALTDGVLIFRNGGNPYLHDAELMEFLTKANWYETTTQTALEVSMIILKLLTRIPEAQRIA